MPSAQTVAALARGLKLPVAELLELRRNATAAGERREASRPGRPIGQWEPHALEVHPASTASDSSGVPDQRVLPRYVEREHDRLLAQAVREAVQGRSRMLVLTGQSSTGKTRACWEAVQPLADLGWRLWHPFDPTRAKAALEELHRVGPRTVVWLNEAQHYLGDREHGERIAAALHTLLIQPERGPVLVLGTLWPDYVTRYTALPVANKPDPHSRVRELLAGRTVQVPDAFDTQALAAAAALAKDGDELLANALTRSRADGRLTQDLAGGPALLERYRTASPPARALIQAAMDASRLGVGLHLPQAFLTDAAADYLHDSDWNQLTDDWAEEAYAELAQPVHGRHAPLRRVTPRPQRRPSAPADVPSSRSAGAVFRLADYLEQHGTTTRRHLCPPVSFWHAALTHLTRPDDLYTLSKAAQNRLRLEWAHHLLQRAADLGNTAALLLLAWTRWRAGDREGAELLYWQAADLGDTTALLRLAQMREEAGDREGAEALARQAADDGDTTILLDLADMRMEAGDWEGFEALYWQAADHGDTTALLRLAWMRDKAGDREGAEPLYRQAADHGDTDVLVNWIELQEGAGDRKSAEALVRQVADHGNTAALLRLIWRREETGDREGAEALARQAADHGDTTALLRLAEMRMEAGDQEGATALCLQGTSHGDTTALLRLVYMWEKVGARKRTEPLHRQAADLGDTTALLSLAEVREKVGARKGAEPHHRQAAEYSAVAALLRLAEVREQAGDREGAKVLLRQASDHGYADAFSPLTTMAERLWPYGLDPDGTPTPRWQ